MSSVPLATLALVLALPLASQGQVSGQSAPLRLTPQETAEAARARDMDRNYDGIISRDEWRGSTQSFREQDWNRDGVLSGDEVPLDPNAADALDWTPEAFSNLDSNRDGRISRNEWQHDPDTFHLADRNGDTVITRAEYLAADGADDADENLFATLDENRNGRIELDEWRRSFEQRDVNGDGVLSRREYNNTATRTAATSTAPTPQMVRVDATQRWTDTWITMRAGDVLRFQAEGTVTMSGANDLADPGGSRTGRRAPNAPVRDGLAGALIGRIGDSAPFLIGATLTAPTSGRLYLGVNDDHLADNSGEFRVTITVQLRYPTRY